MRQAVWIGMAAALLATPPAGAETLRIDGVFAARAREASYLPTIGIDRVSGIDGIVLEEAIGRRLAALDTDGDGGGLPHARLIPPTLRPDGVLTGAVDVDVSDVDYVEGRERCVEKSREKDRKDKCLRRERYKVACTGRTVALRADVRVVRVRDRRLVYDMPRTDSRRDDWCEDRGFALDPSSATHAMLESVAREVRLDLAMRREIYTVRVREDRKGLAGDDAARFRQAVRLTKTDQAAACRTFDAIAGDHGPTLFNRALCAEAEGRYPEAADLYTRARIFAVGAGGEVSKGLSRVAGLAAGAEDRRRPAL